MSPNFTRFNMRAIGALLGRIMMAEALAMAVALIVAICGRESEIAGLAWSVGITAIIGVGLYKIPVHKSALGRHDGILMTVLAWVGIVAFGMLPYLLCGHGVKVSDAAFESMSGFTTTGASTLCVESFGRGLLLWRGLTNWMGGIGIVLLALVFVPMLNKSGGMLLMAAEASGYALDKTSPRIARTALNLFIVYLVLTFACWLLLWLGPVSFFDSVLHTLSTVSTGGFSTHSQSVAYFHSPYIKLVLILFMFLGGANFTLLVHAGKGDWRPLMRNGTFRIYVWVVLGAALLLSALLIPGGTSFSVDKYLIDPLFLVVSTISSTGFTTADFSAWGPIALFVVFTLMFSGACAGSTTGGAKLDRMIVMIKVCLGENKATINHLTLRSVKDGGRILDRAVVLRIMSFLFWMIATMLAGAFILALLGVPAVDAFFSSFSCASNIGLGYGMAGSSFAQIPDLAKWVLTAEMLIGRLELFTVFVLFTRGFWRR